MWSLCMHKISLHGSIFYSENRWKKRGMALTPTKYGIAFTRLPLNQGAALLHVYTDGSVLLSHGGMEMGQGLHTKMVQVCSHLLVIPPERIHIVDTDSGVVANASPTGASHSTDLYGMAVKVRKIWLTVPFLLGHSTIPDQSTLSTVLKKCTKLPEESRADPLYA